MTDHTDNLKDCASVGELLVAYNELDAERRGYIDAHLAQCERCRQELAEIERVQKLACQMRLESPAIDRYPEFLRRLSASRQSTQLQRVDETPLEPTPQLEGGGFAAIVPLFGHRLTVRTGFQRGFELHLTRADGSSLLRVNAGSLTQAAAVVAGTTIVTTGLALGAAMLLMPSVKPPAPPDQPIGGVAPAVKPATRRDFTVPLVTATAGETTLAVWRHRGALYAQLVKQDEPGRRYKLSQEEEEWVRTPMFSSSVKVASDGRSYVVIGDADGALYAWHIDPTSTDEPVPTLVAEHATHVDLVWTGKHYTAVWITPSDSPVVETLDIDRNGRPAETTSQILAATQGSNKLSYPKILVQGSRMTLLYRTHQGGMQGAIYERDQGGIWREQARLKHLPQSAVGQIQLFATDDGCRVVWSAGSPQGEAIHSSLISPEGSFSEPRTLVVSRSRVVDWQSQNTATGFRVAWIEQTPAGERLFIQQFTPQSEPQASPQAIAFQMPVALFGFNAERILLLVDDGKEQQLVPMR